MALLDGINVRDYFAAKAMQSLLSAPYMVDNYHEYKAENQRFDDFVADNAYDFADAMLRRRDK